MNPEKISKFIRELRKEKNLSQYQLADMIPISRQAVSKWERGQTIPDSSTLVRLSDIFEVSINELLKGERLAENTIQELETTTLNIVDESNQKTKKIRKIIVTSTITIVLLLLSFLSYYFINSYNTIKVYTIGGTSQNFDIYEGIFITAKSKTYMKLGKINVPDDVTINNIRVYYLKGKEEKEIFEDIDSNKIIIDLYGYQEHFPEADLKYIIKNTYVEITYNETEKEVIKLTFRRDFVNDAYLFSKSKKSKEDISKNELKNLIQEDIISYMKVNGVKKEDVYILDILEEENRIQIAYYEEMNQIIMSKNDEIMWTIMADIQVYSCPKTINLDEENVTENDSCLEQIKNDVNQYLQ